MTTSPLADVDAQFLAQQRIVDALDGATDFAAEHGVRASA